MTWTWQQPDWAHFTWNGARFRKAEDRFLVAAGMFAGTFQHLAASDQEQITVEAMSIEALSTSEIEGEILDRASVQSSIRRELGLATDRRRTGPGERGVAEMMVDLYRTFSEPVTDEGLFTWHRMLLGECGSLKDIGRYRTGKEPMEVVSGSLHAPKVHFEAPPASKVRKEMATFVRWFNRTALAATILARREAYSSAPRATWLTWLSRAR